MKLQKKINTYWSDIFQSRKADLVLDRLKNRYREPWRHYHTWEHISDLCRLFFIHEESIGHPEIVFLAILYHDCVYDPQSRNNEFLSGELAREDLVRLGCDADTVQGVEDFIFASADHKVTTVKQSLKKDLEYFLDMDLAALGYCEKVFMHNRKNIRKEYSHVSDEDFERGRRDFFNGMLLRNRVFHSEIFYGLYERQARHNLTR